MNENTEAQTNISPDYPLNFLLAVDNKYRTYYIPADIDETIEYLLHIIFSNTPNDADILRKHFKYGKTYTDIEQKQWRGSRNILRSLPKA